MEYLENMPNRSNLKEIRKALSNIKKRKKEGKR